MKKRKRLAAIEAIRQLKAQYWIGVDTSDGDLVRGILAGDCVLDYRACCTDPATGQDHMPAMNVVLRGRDSWISSAFRESGIVTVHQGHHHAIEIVDHDSARGTWSFTDRFFLPEGSPFTRLTGYGFYHDTYIREAGAWKLATTRIERIRVEVA